MQTTADTADALARLEGMFTGLTPATVGRVADFYTPDACFKDPFNDVQGITEIRRVFTQIATQVEVPSFGVTHAVCQSDSDFLTWDIGFKMKRWSEDEQIIHGASHVLFAVDGRVAYHRDYWDAAEELYEKLPVLGTLMRWLKRQAAT